MNFRSNTEPKNCCVRFGARILTANKHSLDTITTKLNETNKQKKKNQKNIRQ